MKKNLHFVILGLCCLVITGQVNAQTEMLLGGDMESADTTAWKINHLNGNDAANHEFGYTAGIPPFYGDGGALHIWASTGSYTQTLFYQEVTLTGGKTYVISGAFMDLTDDLVKYWCEVYICGDTIPEEGTDDWGNSDDLKLKFSTWEGCAAGIDGTFQDDACLGSGDTLIAPGTGDTTLIFGFKMGIWHDTQTPLSYDVLIDEMSLIELGSTAVDHVKYDNTIRVFPNPAETMIQISNITSSEIRLYNIIGKEIMSLTDVDRTVDLDISGLKQGMYIINSGNAAHMFIKN